MEEGVGEEGFKVLGPERERTKENEIGREIASKIKIIIFLPVVILFAVYIAFSNKACFLSIQHTSTHTTTDAGLVEVVVVDGEDMLGGNHMAAPVTTILSAGDGMVNLE